MVKLISVNVCNFKGILNRGDNSHSYIQDETNLDYNSLNYLDKYLLYWIIKIEFAIKAI